MQFSLAEFLHVSSCEGLGDTKGFQVPTHFFAYCYSHRVVVVGLSGLLLFLLYSSLYDWLQGGAGLNFPPYPSCVSCCLHQLPSYRTRIESPEFNTHNTVNLKILTLLTLPHQVWFRPLRSHPRSPSSPLAVFTAPLQLSIAKATQSTCPFTSCFPIHMHAPWSPMN